MLIRKISGDEKFEGFLIAAYAFHLRSDDVEKHREGIVNSPIEEWGAFTDDGTLTVKVGNNDFHFMIDGQYVRAGGIGGVCSRPEYREHGGVREIFKQLLPNAYRNGEVISGLYPFNQAFYRKFGYEVVNFRNIYTLDPAMLNSYKFSGTVKRWNPGDPVDAYLKVYNTFAQNFNLIMQRDEERMLSHIKVEQLFKERKFSYLLSQNGEDIAYVIFTDLGNDAQATMRVEESAWVNREGFYAIMAFLGRFTADYKAIEWPLPNGIDLLKLIQTPRAYDIRMNNRYDYMVRVINAKALLETIRKPADCDFTIRVEDEFIAENNTTLRVTADAVEETVCETPDIAVSVRALAQLAVGAVNLDEAMLRKDVEISAKEDMLRRVFTAKKMYIADHY